MKLKKIVALSLVCAITFSSFPTNIMADECEQEIITDGSSVITWSMDEKGHTEIKVHSKDDKQPENHDDTEYDEGIESVVPWKGYGDDSHTDYYWMMELDEESGVLEVTGSILDPVSCINEGEELTLGVFFEYWLKTKNRDYRDEVKKVVLSIDNSEGSTNANGLFHDFAMLEEADLSAAKFGNCTSMASAFARCKSLKTVKWPDSYDFTNVTSIDYMFADCESISSIDLSSWKLNSVSASDIFSNCGALMKLATPTISGSAKIMLPYVEDSKWYDKNQDKWVPYDNAERCSYLDETTGNMTIEPKIYIGVKTDMYEWSIVDGVLSVTGTFDQFNQYSVSIPNTTMYGYYPGWYPYASYIERAEFNNVVVNQSAANMLSDCVNMTNVSFKNVDFSKANSMNNAFLKCKSLKSVLFNGISFENVTDMRGMFNSCDSLTSIDFSSHTLEKVKQTDRMFANCKSILTVIFSDCDFSSLESADGMFINCENLTEADFSNAYFANRTVGFNEMFSGCKQLQKIIFKNVNTDSDKDPIFSMEKFCEGCTKLNEVDFDFYRSVKIGCAHDMFNGCESIKKLDLSKLEFTDKATYNEYYGYWSNQNIIPEKLTELVTPKIMDDSYRIAMPGEYKWVTKANRKEVTENLPYPGYWGSPANVLTSNVTPGQFIVPETTYSIESNITYQGYVVAMLTIYDDDGNKYANKTVKYTCSDGSSGEAESLDDGVYRAKSKILKYDEKDKTKNAGTLEFEFYSETNDFAVRKFYADYTLKPMMYSDEYKGAVNFGISVEANLGTKAGAGAGSVSASLAEASIGCDGGRVLALSDSLNEKGLHDYKAEVTVSSNIKGEASVGPKAKAKVLSNDIGAEVKALNAEAKGKAGGAFTFGAQVKDKKNINEIDRTDTLTLGRPLLEIAAEVWPHGKVLLQAIEVANRDSTSYVEGKIFASGSAGVTAISAKAGVMKENEEGEKGVNSFYPNISVSGPSAEAGIGYEFKTRATSDGAKKNELKLSTNAKTSVMGVSVGALKAKWDLGSVYSINIGEDFKFSTETVASSGDAKDVKEISLGNVMNKDVAIGDFTESMIRETSFSDIEALSLASNPVVNKFANASMINLSGIAPNNEYIWKIVEDNKLSGKYNDTLTYTSEIPLDIDIGAVAGLGVEGSVGVKLSHEKSYEVANGDFFYNEDMGTMMYRQTSENDIADEDMGVKTLAEYVHEWVNAAMEEIRPFIEVVSGFGELKVPAAFILCPTYAAYDISKNVYNSIVVRAAFVGDPDFSIQSCEIEAIDDISIEESGDDIVPTSIHATVGRFVCIAFEDSNGELIDDLSKTPFDLDIKYTDEYLKSAGAKPSDAEMLAIYRYSDDFACYEYIGGELNASEKYVSAQIDKPGMYVLAINTVEPTVRYCYTSDDSCSPTICVSMMNIEKYTDYSLQLDGEEVVNENNYFEFYNATNGMLEYPVRKHLEDGTHTIFVYAQNDAGNRMSEPYMTSFDVKSVETAKIDSVSVSLDDEIAINLYMTLSEDVAGCGYIRANGKMIEIPYPERDGTYKIRIGVPAKELGDVIKVEALCAGGQPIAFSNESALADGSFEYCIRDYIKATNDGEACKALMDALDMYGLQAQVYFGYKVPSSAPTPLNVVIPDSYAAASSGMLPEDVKYVGSSLVLGDRISIRHYFSGNVEKYVPRIEGRKVAAIKSNGLSYVEVTGIAPAKYGQLYNLKIGEYSLNYGVYSYAHKAFLNGKDGNLKNVMRAMYTYGEEAKKYWERIE